MTFLHEKKQNLDMGEKMDSMVKPCETHDVESCIDLTTTVRMRSLKQKNAL
jgi:hypothetical protein